MAARKRENMPHSNLRERLEEYASLKERARGQGNDFMQEKRRRTPYDFFPFSVLKDMHSFLLFKVTFICLIILIVFALSFLQLPFSAFILERVHYVTTWDMDFREIGEQAIPRVAGLWEGSLEENLETVVLSPSEHVISEEDAPVQDNGENAFMLPLEGEIKRNFGVDTDPLKQEEDMCYGIIIAASAGDYINASAAGVVKEIGEHPYYGLYILLEHEGEIQTLYGYLEEVVVEDAQKVQQGEQVAVVDVQDEVNNALLYFEVRDRGKPVDPLPLLEEN